MEIGSYGGVVFSVSSEAVRTFDEYTRTTAARWAVHEVLLQRPQPEYLGVGQNEITMEITFNQSLGTEPQTELGTLRRMADEGQADLLVIGGQPIGEGDWIIESMEESETVFDRDGRLVKAKAALTLREYV